MDAGPKQMKLYRVKDWDKHFEVSQTRKCARLTWVATPNKHDGKSYRRLMRHPDGAAIYGAWCLILQVASKCPERGVLSDGTDSLTAEDLALKTDCPEKWFQLALELLSTPEIGWLLVADYQHATSTLPARSSALSLQTDRQTDITRQDRQTKISSEPAKPTSEPACSEPVETKPEAQRVEVVGQDEASQRHGSPVETPPNPRAPNPPAVTFPPIMTFPCVGTGANEWGLEAAKIAEWQQTYPGVDVLAECRKARQWCVDNPSRRKTAKGMLGFLNRWLSKVQDDGKLTSGAGRPGAQGRVGGNHGPRPLDPSTLSDIEKRKLRAAEQHAQQLAEQAGVAGNAPANA